MTSSDAGTPKQEKREEREIVLDAMNAKTQEMMKILELSGKDFTVHDCLAFACVTLVNCGAMMPELKRHITVIVGSIVDANVTFKDTIRDGVLSVKTESGIVIPFPTKAKGKRE